MSRTARWAARVVWLKGRAKAKLPDPTVEEKRAFAMGFNMGWKMRGARDRRQLEPTQEVSDLCR